MKQVAKLVMIDPDGLYLMMYRSEHPLFGSDADIPGGTGEDGESLIEIVEREVVEETGVTVAGATKVYSGLSNPPEEVYSLFVKKLDKRPEIIISWEHSRYEWVSRQDFLVASQHAKDDYMHMVYDVMSKLDREL